MINTSSWKCIQFIEDLTPYHIDGQLIMVHMQLPNPSIRPSRFCEWHLTFPCPPDRVCLHVHTLLSLSDTSCIQSTSTIVATDLLYWVVVSALVQSKTALADDTFVAMSQAGNRPEQRRGGDEGNINVA